MKKSFFISDLHLGAPDREHSLERERAFTRWLDQIEPQAEALYLVGDLFDFWFEYKRAVPKGGVRALGKLAELADRGLRIELFTGNHDLWIFDYLPSEIGCALHREPIQRHVQGLELVIGHGDGLGPGDAGYKFLKRIFENRFFQWCFERLHPNFGIGLADRSSRLSRSHTGSSDDRFLGMEGEWLVQYALKELETRSVDAFLFGHRHLPIDLMLNDSCRYINLGDWIKYRTYAVLDQGRLSLKTHRDLLETDLDYPAIQPSTQALNSYG